MSGKDPVTVLAWPLHSPLLSGPPAEASALHSEPCAQLLKLHRRKPGKLEKRAEVHNSEENSAKDTEVVLESCVLTELTASLLSCLSSSCPVLHL